MILLIFEGKREDTIYKSLEALFFSSLPKDEPIVRVYDGNIYDLYYTYKKYGGDVDIVSLLKERFEKRGEQMFDNTVKVSDFGEIYLFFDYDFHHGNRPLEELNNQVQQMLSVFDNETETGKLYISYPMIEALRYTKQLPDNDFYYYTANRDDSKHFKEIAAEFSIYKNSDFITYKTNYTLEVRNEVRHNWAMLIEQNVKKANWLCTGVKSLPIDIDDITPQKLFDVQLRDYVIPDEIVSIVSAFAMFLYDYFGSKIIENV